jgi:Xaa-Pro aminopeptidase
MEKNNLDCVLISSANDVYYYTGCLGLREDKFLLLFPRDSNPLFLVSPLSKEVKERYPNTVFIWKHKDILDHFESYKRVGYDEFNLTANLFLRLNKLKVRLKPFGKFIKEPRMTKDSWEIEQIRKAIKITGKVLTKVSRNLVGRSEIEIANAIDIEFRKNMVLNAFETIVSSGKQTPFVHHKPNERVTKAKDLVLIDLGCKVNGYCSDITRMFCKTLKDREKQIYEDAKAIQKEIIENIKPGLTVKEIDSIQKNLFRRKGYKVTHSFGHGVGLSVHETIEDELKENMVMTVEAGVYTETIGIRIEDMVLVKKRKTEVLSDSIPE